MGVSAFLEAVPATLTQGPTWTRTEGKDFATVLNSERCREMLEDQTGTTLAALLARDAGWHTPPEMLAAIDAMLGVLPAHDHRQWSEADDDRTSYLYTELSGELADFEYYYEGFFVQDLRDFRTAVERAGAAEWVRVVVC